MTKASEQAAAHLLGNTPSERPGRVRGATGDYARLGELLTKDELTGDENEEFETLAGKRRAGTLEGAPSRTVRERQSVAGERGEDTPSPQTKTASDVAAAQLLGGLS